MKTFLFLILFVSLGSLFAEEVIKAGDFKFKADSPWIAQVPKSRMVKGELTYGEKGPVLKFYHFGAGQGGGVEANVTRWKKQFQGEPKVDPENKNFGEQKVAIVKMEGTFLDGPVMGDKTPREGWAMLGAVIPHPTGDVFLKMAGPNAEIAKARKDFDALIASAFAAK